RLIRNGRGLHHAVPGLRGDCRRYRDLRTARIEWRLPRRLGPVDPPAARQPTPAVLDRGSHPSLSGNLGRGSHAMPADRADPGSAGDTVEDAGTKMLAAAAPLPPELTGTDAAAGRTLAETLL